MASRFQVFRKDRKEKERLSRIKADEDELVELDDTIKPVATLTDLTREIRADQALQNLSKRQQDPRDSSRVIPHVIHNRPKALTLEQSRMVFIPSLFGPDPEVEESGQRITYQDDDGGGGGGGGPDKKFTKKKQKLTQKIRRNCCSRKCKLCMLFLGFGFLLVVGGITAFTVYHNGVKIFVLPDFKPQVAKGCRSCPVYCGCGMYESPVISK